jgi:hypothetical protein
MRLSIVDNLGDPECATCSGHGCLDAGSMWGCSMDYCPDCYTKNDKTNNDMIPTKEQNPEGLHGKYKIEKADGSPVAPEAEYFVLRLDKFGDFPHVEAGRKAMKVYADEIEEHTPQLAKDLRERYDLDRA